MQHLSSQIRSHFLRLYQIAVTDGDFSPLEWKQLYHFAEERNISREDLEKILLTTTGEISIPDTLNERIEYLYDLALMSLADGRIDLEEMVTLKKFARKFEFEDSNIDDMIDFLIACAKEGRPITSILNEINKQ